MRALVLFLLAVSLATHRTGPAAQEGSDFDGVIGIGGAGGPYGERFGGRRYVRPLGGGGTERPLNDALDWLARHQAADGGFSADGRAGTVCGCGSADAPASVDATALALLAFLGNGNTTVQGQYKESVQRAIAWLRGLLDAETGRFGDAGPVAQARASLALIEAYALTKSPLLKRDAERALGSLARAEPADDEVGAWIAQGLHAARVARIGVPDDVGLPLLEFLAAHEPPLEPAAAGGAVLARILLGIRQPGEAWRSRILAAAPEGGVRTDLGTTFLGAHAAFQLGQPTWEPWNQAMKRVVLAGLEPSGSGAQAACAHGSWQPDAPSGRVASTALAALTIEVYVRLERVPR